MPSQNRVHQQEVSLDATELEPAQVEKEPAQALEARERAAEERV